MLAVIDPVAYVTYSSYVFNRSLVFHCAICGRHESGERWRQELGCGLRWTCPVDGIHDVSIDIGRLELEPAAVP